METEIDTASKVIHNGEQTGPGQTSRDIVMHHLKSFLDNNVDAVLSDYTIDSVLVTESATYRTLEEIRSFFMGLNMHFPRQLSTFVLDKVVAIDDLVYIVWHATTPSLLVPLGSDTFIIKDGKIAQQTFVGLLDFVK